MVPRPQGSNGTVLHDRSAVRHPAVEYGGSGAKVRDFVSDGATRRVLQMAGHGAEVRITIVNFAGDVGITTEGWILASGRSIKSQETVFRELKRSERPLQAARDRDHGITPVATISHPHMFFRALSHRDLSFSYALTSRI